MRPITRNVLIAIAVVVVLLLALGALPGYLRSGDPNYVVATTVDSPPAVADGGQVASDGPAGSSETSGTDRAGGTSATNGTNGTSATSGTTGANGTVQPFDATNLPANRYPYTMAALANATADAPGRSGPYWRGPVGFKGAFTHSPFDELDAIAARAPEATDGDAVFVRQSNATYRLTIEQEGQP